MQNSDNNTNELILLYSYDNQQAAYIDKGFLEANGIPAKVFANSLTNIFPTPLQPEGQICLYVPGEYYKEARELMESREK